MHKLTEAEWKEIRQETTGSFPGYWLKIVPIKMIRDRLSIGLREAKDAADFAIENYKRNGFTYEDYLTDPFLEDPVHVVPVAPSPSPTVFQFFGVGQHNCPHCKTEIWVTTPEEDRVVTPMTDYDVEPAEVTDEVFVKSATEALELECLKKYYRNEIKLTGDRVHELIKNLKLDWKDIEALKVMGEREQRQQEGFSTPDTIPFGTELP